jgi:hypothetical protein
VTITLEHLTFYKALITSHRCISGLNKQKRELPILSVLFGNLYGIKLEVLKCTEDQKDHNPKDHNVENALSPSSK